MTTPARHPEVGDPQLTSLQALLEKLEKAFVLEYRKLLAANGGEATRLIRVPLEIRRSYQQMHLKLTQALEGSGDTRNLRMVSDLHEQLRIRLLLLEHLLERDIPYIYLNQAMNCAMAKVLVRTASEVRQPQAAEPLFRVTPTSAEDSDQTPQAGLLTRLWHWLFPPKTRPSAGPTRLAKTAISAMDSADGQHFHRLPDHLKRLHLLHHYMEQDQLQILTAQQKVPALGEDYGLQGAAALFTADDLGEYHWGEAQQRPNLKAASATPMTEHGREQRMERRAAFAPRPPANRENHAYEQLVRQPPPGKKPNQQPPAQRYRPKIGEKSRFIDDQPQTTTTDAPSGSLDFKP